MHHEAITFNLEIVVQKVANDGSIQIFEELTLRESDAFTLNHF